MPVEMGYPIAAEAVDLEIYQLACTFAASGPLRGQAIQFSAFRWLTSTFERSEASRRLIALAVTMRSEQDRRPSRDGGPAVGVLIRDDQNPDAREDLSFREACNKLIHADSIDFSPSAGESDRSPPLEAEITLAGRYREKDWEARLHVFRFLNAASSLD